MKIIIVSGGFDPIHSGHIAYINSAKALGDRLIVALNSDQWLINKKGSNFLPFYERKTIIENLKNVDEVIDFEDDKHGSASNALIKIKNKYPNDEIYFCNGGDRNVGNIPEMNIDGIEFIFSVGGDNKANSSSWILKNWQYPSEERLWGKFYNLYQDSKSIKVKELIVYPKQGMSFQRHFKRNEIWLVSKGKCLVNYSNESPDNIDAKILETHDSFFVNVESWHQITNPFDEECKIIEIQYGDDTVEDDIERLYYYENNSET
jgi:cytidyltransferase-like protein